MLGLRFAARAGWRFARAEKWSVVPRESPPRNRRRRAHARMKAVASPMNVAVSLSRPSNASRRSLLAGSAPRTSSRRSGVIVHASAEGASLLDRPAGGAATLVKLRLRGINGTRGLCSVTDI